VDVPIYTREFISLVALGGLLALDDRAGWQSLLAQPLFASLLVGVVVGGIEVAAAVGVAMELVWLAILPMRGARRPDGVAGAIAGAGTACILFRHTGDARVAFLVSSGVFAGLSVGEVAGIFGRRLNRIRERRLGRFTAPVDGDIRVASRALGVFHAASLFHVFLVEAALIAIALPVSLVVAGWYTEVAGPPLSDGARRWLELLPTFGAAAVIQLHWQRHSNRFVVIAAAVALVILWIR
jgi:mannose/fructose/N-acetylgalactosamine-specific phosphotransferase system component IIC